MYILFCQHSIIFSKRLLFGKIYTISPNTKNFPYHWWHQCPGYFSNDRHERKKTYLTQIQKKAQEKINKIINNTLVMHQWLLSTSSSRIQICGMINIHQKYFTVSSFIFGFYFLFHSANSCHLFLKKFQKTWTLLC